MMILCWTYLFAQKNKFELCVDQDLKIFYDLDRKNEVIQANVKSRRWIEHRTLR